ncbi:MAG TPA: sigma-70 family RNA polymerase sigma factor [Acidimicrobiales bacterium]
MPEAEPATIRAGDMWDTDLVAVYRERYGGLVRLAYLLTGHAAVAEEIVQDAFVASHRSRDRLRDPYPYVRRAVVNRCRSWGRRYQVERAHRPRPPDPAELAADEMRDAIDALSERQRIAIVLRFYEDLPDERIAEILGCRRSTVRSSIRRGLQSLRRVIER